MSEHSKLFGFSSAHRWIGTACTGSVVMNQDEVDVETDISREGTAAHYVAQLMLLGIKDGDADPTFFEILIDTTAPNGVVITEDMYDGALAYTNKVLSLIPSECIPDMHIEVRVGAPSIDKDHAWGTLDLAWYHVATNTLNVWDFKFGFVRVEAFENPQCIGYAQAFCETFNLAGINPRISINIFQPRCYDGKGSHLNWTVSFDNLRSFVNNMRHTSGVYHAGTSTLQTGKWCTNCPSSYRCPALLQASAAGVEFSCKPIPTDLSAVSRAYELEVTSEAIKRMEQRKIALSAQIESDIKRGEFVPGWKLQPQVGHRKWNKPDAEMVILGETFGFDFMEKKLKSPSKVEKLIAKKKESGLDETILSAYYHTPKIGVKLVADDGTRARQIFSNGEL